MKSLFWMIVLICSLSSGCATLSSWDPFDDKEDVLVTDISVEAPSEKPAHDHKHSPAQPQKDAGAKHKHPAKAKPKPAEPRLAQNLPADPSDNAFSPGTVFEGVAGTSADICASQLLRCKGEPDSIALSPTTCGVNPEALAVNQPPLVAWGRSECSARRLIIAEVCRMGFRGLKASDITCAAESEQMTCPPTPVFCGPDNRAMVCTAKSYQGSPLQFSQYPKTWGVGECQTRFNLRQFACSLKLDPSQLGDITCEPDYTEGECPVQAGDVCTAEDDKAKKEFFVCEAGSYAGTAFEAPLVTYGESRCEAKAALLHMACQYSNSTNRLRPSQLENINCYSDLKSQKAKTP